MRYLVTGGAGFIGSHLVDQLILEGHEVLVLDDLSSGNYVPSQVTLIKKDICDDVAIKDVDAVFHLAALPRVQYSIQEPALSHDINVNGTLNMLELCRKNDIKQFIFSSSSAVYGTQEILPVTEKTIPKPLSPYGLHKLIGEQYCSLFQELYGIKTVSLRYFNVYGPRQNPAGEYACVIPKFIQRLEQDAQPLINGDGKQTRDFIFVGDVARANLLAREKTGTFNIGSGMNSSINELTQELIKLSGKQITPIHGPAMVEARDTLADISKAKETLGWQPEVSFRQGLQATYSSLRKGKSAE